jgi:large subunit ribosomal protein L6
MSRIGKKIIPLPDKVTVSVAGGEIKVSGPKGNLSRALPRDIEVVQEGKTLSIRTTHEGRRAGALHGLTRTLIANMVTGVSAGFTKGLEISGVGFRAELAGTTLKLFVGYSVPSIYEVPQGITVKIEKLVNLSVSGIDKELVGRVAAEIRGKRKPEPYKGKGIRYAGEVVRRKVGKSAGA